MPAGPIEMRSDSFQAQVAVKLSSDALALRLVLVRVFLCKAEAVQTPVAMATHMRSILVLGSPTEPGLAEEWGQGQGVLFKPHPLESHRTLRFGFLKPSPFS